MTYVSPILNILSKSLRNIGKTVIRDFTEIEKLQSSVRNTKDFVSKTELSVEKRIQDLLMRIKPDIGIEKTNKNKSHTCWLVDAIDNTLNFSRGLENFCLSIALKEKGEIDVCLFYDPLKDEIFFFQKGYGGHKNDSKIRVSEKKEISESIIGINNKYENTNDIYDICFTRELLYKKSVEVRESGSLFLDLCNLACGKFDCCFFVNPNDNLKLISSLMLRETGGMISSVKLKNSSWRTNNDSWSAKFRL